MSEAWADYVNRVSGAASQNEIARTINVAVSSVGRWQLGSEPSPQSVRAFAIAYGRPVIEAFLAAGFFDEEDLDEDRQRPRGDQFEDLAEQEIWDSTILDTDTKWAVIALIRSRKLINEELHQEDRTA